MGIREWPKAERPREKLLLRGAAALSDAELLAIFLRVGSKGTSAVDLARQLLQGFGGLTSLLNASADQFCAHHGLGEAKYTQLQATLELARRHLREGLRRDQVFADQAAVASYLRLHLQDRQREVFAMLFLDVRHRLIQFEELFQGTINSATVYPREVVRRVLELNAAAVILAHNHPSGVAEPSPEDQRITRRLKQALALVDVQLLDHMVVGGGEVVSMAERGLV